MMKAILLAGGKGTRISRFIQDVPKSTLPIGGKPLIRRTVEILLNKKIEVIVCTGYRKDLIHKSLANLNVRYYDNPFYSITNSLGTLWFARNELNSDLIVMNADVFFDEKILDTLLSSNFDVAMASDSSRCSSGDYFFTTDEFNCIVKYGKDIPFVERSSEYVGMVKISETFMPIFKKQLDDMIENKEYDKWWENVLYSLADKGVKINTIDFSGVFWSEIDFYDDYLRIVEYIKTNE